MKMKQCRESSFIIQMHSRLITLSNSSMAYILEIHFKPVKSSVPAAAKVF